MFFEKYDSVDFTFYDLDDLSEATSLSIDKIVQFNLNIYKQFY